MSLTGKAPVLYIPHGGGPLPLLDDPGHAELIAFLREIPARLGKPSAILVISAHWEAPVFTVQDIPAPELLYDYYGFPPEAYSLEYAAPVAHELGQWTAELLTRSKMALQSDATRGYDHGVFVPLKLMYPDADIPCLQLSLREDMDPAAHIALGRALAPLRERNVLILGSGSSFHNMTAFKDGDVGLQACARFDNWLDETCCNADSAAIERALLQWAAAPDARYAHPREEHLLPLHVCFGAAEASAERVFSGDMMGYRMGAYLWT